MSTTRGPSAAPSAESESDDSAVTVHRCTADRVVFTEENNTDGWIATDTTVDLRR
jgi:hypothetical protein